MNGCFSEYTVNAYMEAALLLFNMHVDLPNWSHLRVKILLNFAHANEASEAN